MNFNVMDPGPADHFNLPETEKTFSPSVPISFKSSGRFPEDTFKRTNPSSSSRRGSLNRVVADMVCGTGGGIVFKIAGLQDGDVIIHIVDPGKLDFCNVLYDAHVQVADTAIIGRNTYRT